MDTFANVTCNDITNAIIAATDNHQLSPESVMDIISCNVDTLFHGTYLERMAVRQALVCLSGIQDTSLATRIGNILDALTWRDFIPCNEMSDYEKLPTELHAYTVSFLSTHGENWHQIKKIIKICKTLYSHRAALLYEIILPMWADTYKISHRFLAELVKHESLQVSLSRQMQINLKYCNATELTCSGYLQLTQLRELNLTNSSVKSQDLSQILKLTRLENLSLSTCANIADEGFANLSLLTKLTALDVSECVIYDLNLLQFLESSFAKAPTSRIRTFPTLKQLSLYGCRQITDKGLKQIPTISTLEELSLGRCIKITDQAISLLLPLTNLQALSIADCLEISDEGISSLGGLTNLEDLDLKGLRISSVAISVLTSFCHLKILSLEGCPFVDDDVMSHISGRTNLTKLNVSRFSTVSSNAFTQLALLTHLKTLDLSYCSNIEDRTLKALTNLNRLESLSLRGCKHITDMGLAVCQDWKALQALDIYDCKGISVFSLENLISNNRIKILILGENKIDINAAVHIFAQFTSLHELNIYNSQQITSESGEQLRQLKNLTRLSMLAKTRL